MLLPAARKNILSKSDIKNWPPKLNASAVATLGKANFDSYEAKLYSVA